MRATLFRSRVLRTQSENLHGEVLLLPSVSQVLVVSLALIWLLAVSIWLTQNSYARKETVHGWLEPATGSTRVFAGAAGIVKQILVADGEQVARGQPLMIVNGDRTLASGEQLETLLLTEYERQQSVLSSQLLRADEIFRQRSQDFTQKIMSAERDLELLAEQTQILARREALLKAQVDRYESLQTSGFVASSDVMPLRSQALELAGERQALQRARINQKNRLDELLIQQQLLPKDHANSTDDLTVQLSSIAQQIARLHGQRATVVTAPRSGVIHNLRVQVGQRITQDNLPVLIIVPADAELSVQLMIPVSAAGFVREGQKLDIRYDAFPFQKFGLYAGRIESVSGVVELPNESGVAPVRLQLPTYRAVATLARESVQAYGQVFALKPGMTLAADIQLGERTLLQWFLEPIYSLAGHL